MVLSFTALQDSGVNISVHEIQDNNKTTELRLASERYSVRSPLVLAAHLLMYRSCSSNRSCS